MQVKCVRVNDETDETLNILHEANLLWYLSFKCLFLLFFSPSGINNRALICTLQHFCIRFLPQSNMNSLTETLNALLCCSVVSTTGVFHLMFFTYQIAFFFSTSEWKTVWEATMPQKTQLSLTYTIMKRLCFIVLWWHHCASYEQWDGHMWDKHVFSVFTWKIKNYSKS